MQRRYIIITGIIAVALFSGGGAYALFSDTQQQQQGFHAGTLYLKVDGARPWASAPLNIVDIKPGDSGKKIIQVQNAGSIDGTLALSISGISNDYANNPHLNSTDQALSDCLWFHIYLDKDASGTYTSGDVELVNHYITGSDGSYGAMALAAGATMPIIIDWNVPAWSGNGIMGDGLAVTIGLTLTQL